MAGTVVVVAEYLAVMHHARDALTRAGYRVVTSTNLTAGYGLARLYHPVALVLQPARHDEQQIARTLADLRGDPATVELGVVLVGGEPERYLTQPMLTAANALETPALLRGVHEFAAQAAARLAGELLGA